MLSSIFCLCPSAGFVLIYPFQLIWHDLALALTAPTTDDFRTLSRLGNSEYEFWGLRSLCSTSEGLSARKCRGWSGVNIVHFIRIGMIVIPLPSIFPTKIAI